MFIGSLSLFNTTSYPQVLIKTSFTHHPKRTLLINIFPKDSNFPIKGTIPSYFASKEELTDASVDEEVFSFVSKHLSSFTQEAVSMALTKIADLIYPADKKSSQAQCRIVEQPSGEFDFQALEIIGAFESEEEWDKFLANISNGQETKQLGLFERFLRLFSSDK